MPPQFQPIVMIAGVLLAMLLTSLVGRFKRRSYLRIWSDTPAQDPVPEPVDDEPTPAGVALWPMGLALFGWTLVGVGLAAAAGYGIYRVVGRPHLPAAGAFSVSELLDLLKIGLAVVAGFGGVVALTVTHRRQRVAEAAHQLARDQEVRERRKLFDDRYVSASEQLGSDRFAVRLAGVYSMVGLADDSPQRRQNCVNVLCGYLRSPCPPDDPNEREVRQAALGSLLDRATSPLWRQDRPVTIDFRAAELADIDLSQRIFQGPVNFNGARLLGSRTNFHGTQFRGGASFDGTEFAAGHVDFGDTQFRGRASFSGARFDGAVSFDQAVFLRGLDLTDARVHGPSLSLCAAEIRRIADFQGCALTSTTLDLTGVYLNEADVDFTEATFTDSTVELSELTSVRGSVGMVDARFTGGRLIGSESSFVKATVASSAPPGLVLRRLRADRTQIEFSELDIVDGTIDLRGAEFTDCTVRLAGRLTDSTFERAGLVLRNTELDRAGLREQPKPKSKPKPT